MLLVGACLLGLWACCSCDYYRLWQMCTARKKRYRSIPGVAKQFSLLLRRAGIKWVRRWQLKFVDLLLFVGAAIVVGECTL